MKRMHDTTRVLATVPNDVREWLVEQATHDGATISAEIVISVRERMKRMAEAAAVG